MTDPDNRIICDHCGKELVPGVDAIYSAEKIGDVARDYCSLEYLIFFQTYGTAEIVHSLYLDELVACWHIRHEKDERDSLIELPYALSFGGETTNRMAITRFGEIRFVLSDREVPVVRTHVELRRPGIPDELYGAAPSTN